jgi:hypothetical protein
VAGSDAGRCIRAAPCASLARAYALARPGTIVRVGGGRYGAQTIESRPGLARPRVIFQPARGAKVTVSGELRIRASHLEMQRMTLDDLELPREANDVVFRNIRNHGVWMQGPSNIAFFGGEVSCGVCPFHSHLDDGGPPDFRPPRNILFDSVSFHDWQAASAGQHTECLQILAGNGITIRNSVFRNCATANNGRGATANLHISWLGNGPKTRNILIENNFFYRSGNTYAIQAGDYANLRFRYNSIVGPILVAGGFGDGTPVELVGNVMGFAGCSAARSGPGQVAPLRFLHNVLDGGKCSSSDINARSGFVNSNANLHLRPRAAAINRGDARSYPKRDIDGSRRPKGGRPDAGADEAR